jgi:hypothetical protein
VSDLRVILFDETGQECRIELLKSQMDISQAEINALIASLRFKT